MSHPFSPSPHRRRTGWVGTLLGLGCLVVMHHSPAAEVSHDQVAPLLQRHCTVCHSGNQAPIGLRLDSLEGVLRGSSRGPVVQAGDPAGSELIRRLRGVSQPRMPLSGPPYLPEAQIELFEQWIRGGLQPGRGASASTPAAAPAAPAAPAARAAPADISGSRNASCDPVSTARMPSSQPQMPSMAPAGSTAKDRPSNTSESLAPTALQ